MREFNKILVPIDFSEVSTVLVPYAKYLAQRLGSEIHLLYVARTLEYFSDFDVPSTSIETFEGEILEGAKKRMERFVEEHFKDTDVKTDVLSGDAATKIIGFAEKGNFDLILIGTHGRKWLDKVIFGSVTDRVIKGAMCPVLTVNPYWIKH